MFLQHTLTAIKYPGISLPALIKDTNGFFPACIIYYYNFSQHVHTSSKMTQGAITVSPILIFSI